MVVLSIAVMTCNAIGAVYVIVGVVSVVARVVAAGFIVVLDEGGVSIFRYLSAILQYLLSMFHFCRLPFVGL